MSALVSLRKRRTSVLIFSAIGLLGLGIYLTFRAADRSPLVIADGIPSEVDIIHVQKRGRLVSQTNISVFRDGFVTILTTTSRIPQYRPKVSMEQSLATAELKKRVVELAASVGSLDAKSQVTGLLLRWNSDHWYVATRAGVVEVSEGKARAYLPTTETLFEDLTALPTKDIARRLPGNFTNSCLGLCFRFHSRANDHPRNML